MFGRLLSFLGFVPGLSGVSGLAGGYGSGTAADEGLDADGEAAVSFTPGQPLASADSEETPDSRRARITDRDLVWPGRVETIHISNPEPIMYRFDLTVTDLNPAFYIRQQPKGGVPQREGGVLLQPGEEASFDVVFVPPPAGDRMKTRTFSFVLTCFDPRRSGDSGEIVQDLPLRWVALPSGNDLQITAAPTVVVTRPWRREAQFAVQFANKSFLPPTVGMTILRAPTKDALERDAETVGTIQQSLTARTPGVWQCLLPPPARRGSYYATVRGAAQVGEGVTAPLTLPRPVLIRYFPWLRLGRDWAFLIGSLLLLLWLVWGIPVRKTPVVRATIAFAGLNRGQMPADSQLKDLNAQMLLLDERGHDLDGQQPIPGVVIGDAFEFTGPTRIYGFRWPFGRRHWWNVWSREKQQFRIALAPAEAEKSAFKRYDLNALQADGTPAYSAENTVTPFSSLVMPTTFMAPAIHSVLVSLQLGHLGALAGRDLHRVSVQYWLDGQEQPVRTFEVLHDTTGSLRPIALDLTDDIPLGGSKTFRVKVTADGLTSEDIEEIQVRRRSEPLPITLTFPDSYPKIATKLPVQPPVTPKLPTAPSALPVHPPITQAITQAHPPITPQVHPPVTPKLPTAPSALPVHPPITQAITQAHPPITPASPSGPPAAPAGLIARPVSPSQISLHWNPVPDAAKYILYRSGGPEHGRGVKYLAANVTSFTDTGLTPGIIYHYRIQSKRGSLSSPQSSPTSVLTPALMAVPATVTLAVNQQGKDLDAVLDFVNVSSQKVYLDKISACDGGKIRDDVFRVLVDGQIVPFTGHKSNRPQNPGPRQFITVLPGENVHETVKLNQDYRLPSGSHACSVVYSALHLYPARLQNMTLTSNAVNLNITR